MAGDVKKRESERFVLKRVVRDSQGVYRAEIAPRGDNVSSAFGAKANLLTGTQLESRLKQYQGKLVMDVTERALQGIEDAELKHAPTTQRDLDQQTLRTARTAKLGLGAPS